MKKNNNFTKYLFARPISIFVLIIFVSGFFVSLQGLSAAWSGPTASPPIQNIPEFIHTGNAAQIKTGPLGVQNNFLVGSDLFWVDYVNKRTGVNTINPSTTFTVNGVIAVGALSVQPQAIISVDNAYINIGDLMGGDGLRGLVFRAGDQDRLIINQAGSVGFGGQPNNGSMLTVYQTAVPLILRETDHAIDNGGLWRLAHDGGNLRFDRNRSVDGSFSAFDANFILDNNGNLQINNGYIRTTKEIRADKYCDENGNNCFLPESFGSGAGGVLRGSLCGLHKRGNELAIDCFGHDPQWSCPSGYQQIQFKDENPGGDKEIYYCAFVNNFCDPENSTWVTYNTYCNASEPTNCCSTSGKLVERQRKYNSSCVYEYREVVTSNNCTKPGIACSPLYECVSCACVYNPSWP